MQQNSTNQHLNNLSLSFSFYKTLLVNQLKTLKSKVEDPTVLESVTMIERFSHHLIIQGFMSHYQYLFDTYKVVVDIDWHSYFEYFDLLDSLILPQYDSSQWSGHQNIISKQGKYEHVTHFALAYYSLRKLQRLIPRILYEMYRDQYSINHYYHLDQESLKETDFMTEGLIYDYFLKEQGVDAIETHLEHLEKKDEIKTNATKYLQSIELAVSALVATYGDDIQEDLSLLLDRSYYNKLNLIKMIRDACHSVNSQKYYSNLSYESFFCFTEFFAFRLNYPAALRVNSEPLYNRETIERDVTNAINEFGPEIEERYRNLYCYLIMVENLLVESMQLHMYVKSGTKPKLGDLSLETTLDATRATFKLNPSSRHHP